MARLVLVAKQGFKDQKACNCQYKTIKGLDKAFKRQVLVAKQVFKGQKKTFKTSRQDCRIPRQGF